MGSIGPASAYQLGLEALKRRAKVDITYVPFAGSAPAINALLGQHVTSVFAGYANIAELIAAGKVRALAVASRNRIEPLPNTPTVIEAGYKDFEVDNWFGLFAPAKTPPDIASQLAGWFTEAVKAAEIRPKLADPRPVSDRTVWRRLRGPAARAICRVRPDHPRGRTSRANRHARERRARHAPARTSALPRLHPPAFDRRAARS